MINYLKQLLSDIKKYVVLEKQNQKILALETAIEILEKLRRDYYGNSKK